MVTNDLSIASVGDVLLSVKEPVGDLELGGVLNDGDHLLDLIIGELTSTEREREMEGTEEG